MSRHQHDEDDFALAHCSVCGAPITDEDSMYVIKDFAGEGHDAVFCEDHYDKLTTGGSDD